MKHLLPILLLTACTASTDTQETDFRDVILATEAAWSRLVSPISPACRYEAVGAIVEVVGPEEIHEACDIPDRHGEALLGCFRSSSYADPIVFINAEHGKFSVEDTVAHEWVHLLAWCHDGDQDLDHSRAELWGTSSGVWWDSLTGF